MMMGRLIFFFSLIIPTLTTLFFVYAPKEAQRDQLESTEFETNPWLILQVLHPR